MKPAAPTRKRILVVDDDPGVRESLVVALTGQGWEIEAVETGEAALVRLNVEHFDVIILDERMPGLQGREVIREIQRRQIRIAVLFMTAYGEESLLRELLELHVDAYCDKPFQLDELLSKLSGLFARQADSDLPFSTPPSPAIPGLIGRSAAMQVVYEQIRTLAAADLNVFITGETGVGKECVARAIHALSRRASAPFLSINCANLEPALLESELFGHVAGAFTDARRNKRGLLVEAAGSIVFLDEVTELPGSCQAKLLKVIQDKEVRPVGGVHPIQIDVRFVAASNEDVQQAIRDRRFRADLFHRLAVGTIHVPPLRDRLEDLPDLVHYILSRLADASGKPVRGVTPRAMQKLLSYDWPGNVRELENVLELAVAYADGPVIEAAHIRLHKGDDLEIPDHRLDQVLKAAERAHILRVLRVNRWVKSRAAAALGIARSTLDRKIEEYHLDQERLDDGS